MISADSVTDFSRDFRIGERVGRDLEIKEIH